MVFAVLWLIFGIAAIITAIANLICFIHRKETKWFRFISLSLTALTLCAFYAMASSIVLSEDWSAALDVISPAMSNVLWFLTILSILLNSISLFQKRK